MSGEKQDEREREREARMDGEEEKSDERCIQEIIAQFYSFFGSMMMLKQCIDQLPELHEASRGSILSQLEIIESEPAATGLRRGLGEGSGGGALSMHGGGGGGVGVHGDV